MRMLRIMKLRSILKTFSIILLIFYLITGLGASAQYMRIGSYGGTLVQAIIGDPPHLNPGITTSVATLVATSGIFESLLRWDDYMNPYPALAERWEVTDDAKSYTFYLVKNATWHDGLPFTAYDVKFTFEKILSKYHPRARVVLASLEGVEIIDNYTVKFRFKEPNPMFLYILNVHNAPILPMHLLEGYVANITAAPFNLNPVGTGPFKFVEWRKGEYVKLEKYPSYYIKGFPYLDSIVTRIFRDPLSAILALERGEVDYITGYYMPLSEAKRLQGKQDIVVTGSGASVISPIFVMFYNLDRDPTSIRDFRVAVAHAINRSEILEKVFFGFGKVATGPIPSSHWAYEPNVTIYDYNPSKASEILDRLGFKDVDGDGYREYPNGTKLVLELPYNAGVIFHERTAQLVAEMLRKIGIRVEIKPYDEATLTMVVYSSRSFHITFERFSTGPDPSIGVARLYHSSYAGSKVPFTNAAPGYRNELVDRLLNQAAMTADKTYRARLFSEFQKIISNDLPILVLLEVVDPNIFRASVKGLHSWSAESRVERIDVWIQRVLEEQTPVRIKTPLQQEKTTTPAEAQTNIPLIAVITAVIIIAIIFTYIFMRKIRIKV